MATLNGKWMAKAIAAATTSPAARRELGAPYFDSLPAKEQEGHRIFYWLLLEQPMAVTVRHIPEIRRLFGTRFGNAWRAEQSIRFLLCRDYRANPDRSANAQQTAAENNLIALALQRYINRSEIVGVQWGVHKPALKILNRVNARDYGVALKEDKK